MSRALALALLSTVSGCFTASAQLRAGPTVDTRGEIGYELGASIGFGLLASERAAVRSMPGVSTSDRAGAALTETVDVLLVDDGAIATIGLTGELLSTGPERVGWLHAAGLIPVRHKSRRSGGGKSGLGSRAAWWMAAGLEARAGFARDPAAGTSRGVFALLSAADLTALIALGFL